MIKSAGVDILYCFYDIFMILFYRFVCKIFPEAINYQAVYEMPWLVFISKSVSNPF